MKSPTIERLREMLHYNAETGVFTRAGQPKRGTRRVIGAMVGRSTPRGYIILAVDGQRMYAHRVAWAMHYGSWPTRQVDHINGNRADNRIANLRDVTAQVNLQNRRTVGSRTTTGYLGVSIGRQPHKYRAHVRVNGKQVCLGQFDTAEEAHAAYVSAKRQLHEGSTL